MSRIDEALKRLGSDLDTDAVPQAELPVNTESPTLQQYPSERPAAPRRLERVASTSDGARSSAQTIGIARESRTIDGGPEGRLVVGDNASQVLVEQYRRLAAVLDEAQTERQLKVLAVTSALPREGKTLTVTNLALTLAESYARRVLIVDADLRRPTVHSVLGVPEGPGLNEALGPQRASLRMVDLTPRLSFLPAGKPNHHPLVTLSSGRMRALIDQFSAQYDWVLLDTPPVGLLSDAQIVARLAGAVLFVIGANATPHAVVERAINEIGRDNVIGTVLNRVEDGSIPENSYYNHYYSDAR